ncbi:hypothetical protein JOF56_003706 [Kibdelosporangium banguiense]|uniref:Uncharacterized protein n=1 Tax=Kibdelosporangium banguiense TaxID=1365924 RepID=A0ABS4THM4_9PSEU|nr:hypothetical protein [Kibdelosporangium banguiense]MBP2323321.1 hypothetical protein [Kibdelosporangium banguiense]
MPESYEKHVIGGTTFSFPPLPPKDEIDPVLFERLTTEREKILDEARKVKPTKRTAPRGVRTPKPGNGVFEPEPGAPGSVLEVDGRRFEVWCSAPTYLGHRAVWATVEGSVSYWHVNCHGSYQECDARGHRVEREKEA